MGRDHRLLTAEDVHAMPQPAPGARIPYGPHPHQFGRLSLPEGSGPHPVVVFLHGGCWRVEYDVGHVGRLEAALAEEGFAVWSLEYRRVGEEEGGWPFTFLDAAAGIDFLATLASAHPLDLARVVTAGHSAGGHLALWLACRRRVPPDSEIHLPNPFAVHAVLALAPAAALELLWEDGTCDGAVNALMGGGPHEVPERYAAGSPMKLLPVPVPVAVVLGREDHTWAPAGRAFCAAAEAAPGPGTSLIEIDDAGHFELIIPGCPAWGRVVQALRALLPA